MHIISRKKLNEFVDDHPDSRSGIASWYQAMKNSTFSTFAELRTAFPSADKIGKLTVFNIGGNKARLIAAVYYNRKRIYIRAVLAHREHDKNKWKE